MGGGSQREVKWDVSWYELIGHEPSTSYICALWFGTFRCTAIIIVARPPAHSFIELRIHMNYTRLSVRPFHPLHKKIGVRIHDDCVRHIPVARSRGLHAEALPPAAFVLALY